MRMKSLFLSLVAVLALAPLSWAADVTVTISKVHLCCDKCVTAVDKVVASVPGATAVADKTARTIAITAADAATVQKAADALVKAGFYGESSDASVKMSADMCKKATWSSRSRLRASICAAPSASRPCMKRFRLFPA